MISSTIATSKTRKSSLFTLMFMLLTVVATPTEAANCSDGEKNGDETDVDCGGDTCDKCIDGKTCEVSVRDCASSACSDKLRTCVFTPALAQVNDCTLTITNADTDLYGNRKTLVINTAGKLEVLRASVSHCNTTTGWKIEGGGITIENLDMEELDVLKDLVAINGKDENFETSLSIFYNQNLLSLRALSNLQGTLPGMLHVASNPKLLSLSGIEGITQVGYGMIIKYNDALCMSTEDRNRLVGCPVAAGVCHDCTNNFCSGTHVTITDGYYVDVDPAASPADSNCKECADGLSIGGVMDESSCLGGTQDTEPTAYPSASPTPHPSAAPTAYPSAAPTPYPTKSPSNSPTEEGCSDGRKSGDETDIDCGGSCVGPLWTKVENKKCFTHSATSYSTLSEAKNACLNSQSCLEVSKNFGAYRTCSNGLYPRDVQFDGEGDAYRFEGALAANTCTQGQTCLINQDCASGLVCSDDKKCVTPCASCLLDRNTDGTFNADCADRLTDPNGDCAHLC